MTRARTPRPQEIEDARRDERLLRAHQERDRDPAWRTRGVCQSVDPETFFPAPSEPADAAVALCRTCSVQGPCLAWALQAGDLHGVWGGTTARERRAMAVAWRTGPQEPGPAEPAPQIPGHRVPGQSVPGQSVPGQSVPARSVPGQRPPAELPEVGSTMDRAELLRLVNAR